jgi:acetyltransferase-like isoleucine patch superfamily enzyme
MLKIRLKGRLTLGKNYYIGDIMSIQVPNTGKIRIGPGTSIRKYSQINVHGNIDIGENVFINSFTAITSRESIIIGDNTMIANNVSIYDHNHIISKNNLMRETGFNSESITIGKNVWIGCSCTILAGSQIPDNTVIGAGSIVTKKNELLPGNIYAGNPLKHIKQTEG